MFQKRLTSVSIQLLIAFFFAGMVACKIPGKVTGGGTLPSAAPTATAKDKANFGFNAAQCVQDGPVDGKVNYVDKKDGVKFNGNITDAGECVTDDIPPEFCGFCESLFEDSRIAGRLGNSIEDNGRSGLYQVEFDYKSTNPKAPGTGAGIACVGDSAEFDLLAVSITSGPYSGYFNSEEISGGNIQAHDCTCTDGVDNDGDGCVDAEDPGCQGPTGLNGDESSALGVCSL